MSMTKIKAKQATYKSDATGGVVRSLHDKVGEFVSVKDFGAVGDGVTDDTSAIQAAIQSLGGVGGSIYFPIGEYLCDNNLTCNKLNVRFFGETGGNATNQTAGALYASAIRFTQTAGDNLYFHNSGYALRRIIIEDLMLHGGTSGNVLNFDNCTVVDVSRCIVTNSSDVSGATGINIYNSYIVTVRDSFVKKRGTERTAGTVGINIAMPRGATGGLYNFNNTTSAEWATGIVGGLSEYAGDATGATATAAVSGGSVASVTVTAGGTGYPSDTAIVIVPHASDTTATGAEAVATVVGGVITDITVTSGGTGYNNTPTISIRPNSITANFNFYGSQVKSCTTGITLQDGITGVDISGCYIEGNTSRGLDIVKGASEIFIKNCFFNNPAAINCDVTIGRATSTSHYYFKNIVLDGCRFNSISVRGVYIISDSNKIKSDAVTIRNCYFKAYTPGVGTGIATATGTSRITTVENCQFESLATNVSGKQRLIKLHDADTTIQLVNIETLTGTRQLDYGEPRIHSLTADTTARTLKLPLASSAVGAEFLIANVGPTYNIVVKDSTGVTTYQTLTPGQRCIAWNDGVSDYTNVL